MIEVLFGESEAGSMKAAKNKIVIGRTDGPTSVWMAGKKRPPERPFAGWVEGTADEVVCLGFMLDIGDIKEPVDSLYRKKLIYSMYAQNQWERDEAMEKELKQTADVYVKELSRLKRFLDDGETVRIWYSDAPYSRCGFYHLCRILQCGKRALQSIRTGVRLRRKNLPDSCLMKRNSQKKKFVSMGFYGASWRMTTVRFAR